MRGNRVRKIAWLAAAMATMGGAPALTGCAAPRGETAELRKAWTDAMAEQTLAELRADERTATRLDERGVALGVFEVVTINALIFSTTGGYGVIIDRDTGERTYVEVRGGGPGLGAGFTRARSVYVLRSQDAADAFRQGAVSWNGAGEIAWRPNGRGFSVDGVGSLLGSTAVYHDIRHGISAGASVQAVGIFP